MNSHREASHQQVQMIQNNHKMVQIRKNQRQAVIQATHLFHHHHRPAIQSSLVHQNCQINHRLIQVIHPAI